MADEDYRRNSVRRSVSIVDGRGISQAHGARRPSLGQRNGRGARPSESRSVSVADSRRASVDSVGWDRSRAGSVITGESAEDSPLGSVLEKREGVVAGEREQSDAVDGKRASLKDAPSPSASGAAPASASAPKSPGSVARALSAAEAVMREMLSGAAAAAAAPVPASPARRPPSVLSKSSRVSAETAAAAMAHSAARAQEQRVFHEVGIERQRILAVLDELVERLEVALCLPLLVQHAGNTTRNCFLSPHEEKLLEACGEYSMKAPPMPKHLAHRVPTLAESLAAPPDEMRSSVLRTAGRLKAVRRMEKELQRRKEEEERKSKQNEDYTDVFEEENAYAENQDDDDDDDENSDSSVETKEMGGEESPEGSDKEEQDKEEDDIFSVGEDYPFSIGGYSSSYFEPGNTSDADKAKASVMIHEMLRRREIKIAARKEAEAVATGVLQGAVVKAEIKAETESFWGAGSTLDQRAIARFRANLPITTQSRGSRGGYGDSEPLPRRTRLDSRVASLLDALYSRPLLRKAVKQFLLPEISQAAKVFLEYARGLRQCAAQRLQRSPREESAREEQLRRVYARNSEAANELRKLEAQLAEARAAGDQELTQREGDVEFYEKRMERLCYKHKADMIKRENASERSMVMDWKSSQLRQMAMENELQEMQAHLQELQEKNLEGEREMRQRRQRLERQLEAIISTYDHDMTDRQAHLDKVTSDLQRERETLELLQQQMVEQEEDYKRLLEERSAEEEVEFQKKLYQFLVNRSARVIQRTWRAYHERRLAKRKAKKGKKGKKDKKK